MKRTAYSTFSPDLTRLFAAAVVSNDFCHTLLNDAASALANGYCGETFALPPVEEAVVLSIKASTLTDFASQLVNKVVPTEASHGTRPAVSAPSRSYPTGTIGGAFQAI